MNLELFPNSEPRNMLEFESVARRQGFQFIAGIDEAGRGPLAGPVVAAAVILPDGLMLAGVDDSKKLSESRRNALFEIIMKEALTVGVGISPPCLIDRINILQATLRAMESAVANLSASPDCLLIDGISKTSLNIHQKTIKKGDSLSLSIASASIIAKVTRDRMMEDYDRVYPGYGFAGHKGYGAASHMAAIAALGPSPIHRLTFRGVKEHAPDTED
ncbi:MAG: ribonuclease HII [Geobacteraceae bacterium]|nr:ribonuclease HII [Geobacteraceae bacterium]